MKYMLTLLVVLIGLEGVDRALLERAMGAIQPPRQPAAWWTLLHPEPVKMPSPPPPALARIPEDSRAGD